MAEDTPATKKRTKRTSKKTTPSDAANTLSETQIIDSANPAEPSAPSITQPIEGQPEGLKKTPRKRTVKKSTESTLPGEGGGSVESIPPEKKTRARKKTTPDADIVGGSSPEGAVVAKRPRARKKTESTTTTTPESSKGQISPKTEQKIIPEIPKTEEKKEEAAPPKPKSMEEILDRIPSFSGYLINRMSKDAQKALRLGVLEMNRMKTSDLEKAMEHLTPVRMFFDASYENEKEILDFIEQKMAYMNKILEQLHEKEGETLVRKEILEPLAKGKFDKIIRKWGPEYSVDECAYQILEKIGGRTLKKIPLSEFVLRKKLIETLKEKYPDKTR